jgi:hypothetical protein
MPPKKSSKRTMSQEHKEALAAGRESARAVRVYLDAVESTRPKRGRRRTPESIQRRLAAIEDEIPGSDPTKRLHLIQERIDLTAELSSLDETVDLTELEKAFIQHAADYSERKGISYAAWRELGIPAATLRSAGISRAS